MLRRHSSLGLNAEREASRRDVPAPSLTICNNSTEQSSISDEEHSKPTFSRCLSSTVKKRATVVRKEVEYLEKHYPKGRLVMLTITLPEKGNLERSECEKRFHSLQTHHLSKVFCRAVVVFQRAPKTGRPHYHVVAVLRAEVDVREGFDWAAYDAALEAEETHRKDRTGGNWARMMNARKKYGRSAPQALRDLWKNEFSPETMAKYGFGIAHVMAIRNGKAAATYTAKYLTKEQDFDPRYNDEDKGKRSYWVFGEGHRACGLRHTPVTKTSLKWRRKVEFAAYELGFTRYDDFQNYCGPRWFHFLGDAIQDIPWEYVACCERYGTVFVEDPRLQDWPWIKDGKKAIERLGRCFYALFDERDKEIPTPNETASFPPPGQGGKRVSHYETETQLFAELEIALGVPTPSFHAEAIW